MKLSRLGRLSIAAAAVAVAALATAPRVRGDLDRIAADGVTEHGGSPEYARMLPRTGADGVLDASLLPPVADWASQPIARLYYAAASATRQGNGSPQYPFTTLAAAFTNMTANSALLMAPGTYSGAVTLEAGTSLTLLGAGGQPYVSSLSVTAVGSSAATTLDLCGVRVGTLSVAGGKVNVRLSGTAVERLEGTSPSVTVIRTDLGSTVGVSTLAHVDAYTGYDTVPKAEALVDPVAMAQLALSGGRARVSADGRDHVVAFVSDVSGATNAAYDVMRTLQATNSALSARIDAEAATRAAYDTATSNRLDAVKGALETQIAGVGTSWNTRLATVSEALGGLQSELRALLAQETNDVRGLTQSVASLRTAYLAADSVLRDTLDALSAEVTDLGDGLEGRIDARAAVVADARIATQWDGIVSNAAVRATAAANASVSAAYDRLDAIMSTNYSGLASRVSSVEGRLTRLNTVTATLNTLIAQLANAQSGGISLTNTYNIALPARIL